MRMSVIDQPLRRALRRGLTAVAQINDRPAADQVNDGLHPFVHGVQWRGDQTDAAQAFDAGCATGPSLFFNDAVPEIGAPSFGLRYVDRCHNSGSAAVAAGEARARRMFNNVESFGLEDILATGGQYMNETQTITIDATGGTFTVTYSGQTTSAVDWNATGDQLQAALEALSNLDPGDVSVWRGGDVFTITFGGSLADTNVAAVTTNAGSLTGGAGTAVVATSQAGGGSEGLFDDGNDEGLRYFEDNGSATDPLGAAGSASRVIGELESAFLDSEKMLGVLHVPVVGFPKLVEAEQVQFTDGMWRTKLGSYVSIGVGYTGRQPDGSAAASDTTWLYYTGDVHIWRDPIQILQTRGQGSHDNVHRTIAQRLYAVAPDGEAWFGAALNL